MIKCIKCGNDYEGNFCNVCGQKNEVNKCKNCGNEFVGRFCNNCGKEYFEEVSRDSNILIDDEPFLPELQERNWIQGHLKSISTKDGKIILRKTISFNGDYETEINASDINYVIYSPYKFGGLGKETYGFITFVNSFSRPDGSMYIALDQAKRDSYSILFGPLQNDKFVKLAQDIALDIGAQFIYQEDETTYRKNELDRQGVAYCPKCLSTSLSANKKGFGVGKAVVGLALTGGLIGLAAGNFNAKKVRVTCLKCGHQFWAGVR